MQPHATDDFPIERRVAAHLAATAWADLPAPSREGALRAILWWLATGLEGITEANHASLLRYVEQLAGPAEAAILGTCQRTTAELAGLVNGRAGKAWEHEDKYWVDETIGFAVGCCVVPAAIAAAEAQGAVSGTALATAVALAIDLEIRLLRPLGLGFVPGQAVANATFTLGTYGAAVAAAKILGLGAEGFLDALGLAHCQAAGNFQGQVEGRGVATQAGFAVRNGIAAARMAAAGMPGPTGSLTGRCGLYPMHYPNCMVAAEEIVHRLGEEFLNVHLGFKGYPCGVVAHPVIDAVLSTRASLNGRPVQAIDVFGASSLAIMASPIERKRAPASVIEAQFSIPWAAACAIRDGHFSISHYDDAALRDPELRRLAGLVNVHMRDEANGTAVTLTLSDGTALESPVITGSRGNPKNPLPTTEIEDILYRAAERLGIRSTSARRAVALLREIESLKDCRDIMTLLSDRET
ncbi:MmgE/PrpD family protein (plasmid) [Cupriavidus pinatubonensis]|uniref:MmgE/PrpD family protein n=1 Tax=Cupriavidus pinatubonensis TaxID=248026 RepID=UPI001C72F5DB|nr:MmgE/PrpD family protein [Cupriavidus pinatubonensis]QYY33933.1 MmgE/PrpD family protein [Cupriavidus pinatubonensis]